MDTLNKVIDVFIENKADELGEKVSTGLRKEFCDTIREKTKEQIIKEIKNQCIDEIVTKAEEEINRKQEENRLREMKNLLWQGFIVAMCVGLFVNQVTDVISYYKGINTLEHIYPTVIICLILLAICVGMYLVTFIKQFMEFFSNKK